MTLETLQKNRHGLLTMYMRDAYEKAREIIESIPEYIMQEIVSLATVKNPIKSFQINAKVDTCEVYIKDVEVEIPNNLMEFFDGYGFKFESVGVKLNDVIEYVEINFNDSVVIGFTFKTRFLKYIDPKVKDYNEGLDYYDREDEEKNLEKICEKEFGEFLEYFSIDDDWVSLDIKQEFFD